MPRNTAIKEFLEQDYLSDYSEILSMTVGITHYYPQQADSQVRNAMTHLSRASTEISNLDEEINKAKGHLERAKRDCLKLSIIEKKKHVENEIKSLRYAQGTLTESIKEKRLSIAMQHKKASIQETIGSRDVSTLLEVVLTELLELEQELIKIDEIVKKPSTSVKIAYSSIVWAKRIFSMMGIIYASYLLKEYGLPFLSEYLF